MNRILYRTICFVLTDLLLFGFFTASSVSAQQTASFSRIRVDPTDMAGDVKAMGDID